MTKKSFQITDEEQEVLTSLRDFFNETTDVKTFRRILEFAKNKLLS